MKLTSLKPIIWTEQLEETIHFYTTILGFRLNEKNDDWGWASLQHDAVEMMIAKPNGHSCFSKPIFTGSFYFNADDIDTVWENLKGKAAICYEIENFDWEMREFAIYDNNGYILQFGQPIAALEEVNNADR